MKDWTATTRHGVTRKKKRTKRLKAYMKPVSKEPAVKRCLLILDLKPFRSYVKAKDSIGRQALTYEK